MAFSWAVTSTGLGGLKVYGLCEFFLYQEHPNDQPIVVLEKPGVEPMESQPQNPEFRNNP